MASEYSPIFIAFLASETSFLMGSITFNWTMKEEKEITENKPKHIQEKFAFPQKFF